MIRIVTTFSRVQWENYVHRLLPRSIDLWPKEVQWQIWLDNKGDYLPMFPIARHDGNVEHKFLSDDPEHETFMQRWNDRVRKNPALKHEITVKRYPTGYTLDAGTFAHKVFALTSKEARDGADWLIFLGSDVETLAAIDMDYLGRVLSGDIVHLGRRDIRSSETDWLAIHHPFRQGDWAYGPSFLEALRAVYTSGDLFHWAEWIDGYAIARLIAIFQGMGAEVTNLSEGLPGLDVWEKSVLGERTRHWKGPYGKKQLMATA